MYFIKINGNPVGPMSGEQLMAYRPNPNTSVSTDGCTWYPLYSFPDLMELVNRNHPESYGHDGYETSRERQADSKKVLCGIMAILFGTLGIQYFVIGKTRAGFLTILISLVTCGSWEIITFIQGIMMLCMSDGEFERKYVNSRSWFPLF